MKNIKSKIRVHRDITHVPDCFMVVFFVTKGVSTRCRIEKKEENKEGTQTRKHPNGYPQLEVFEKAATKKDDHNHPNSLQRVNYRKENINTSGNMVNICMIRALF